MRMPKPKKTETEYLRLKTEPNRTKIEKFSLIGKYTWLNTKLNIISVLKDETYS